MRNVIAKRLKSDAQRATKGYSAEVTRLDYLDRKRQYKALRKQGLLVENVNNLKRNKIISGKDLRIQRGEK